jgi:hypothetical protein
MVSRTGVLAIFGAIGFAIGFLVFLATPAITDALAIILPQIIVDKGIAFAMVSGFAGAAISTTVVNVWAKRP